MKRFLFTLFLAVGAPLGLFHLFLFLTTGVVFSAKDSYASAVWLWLGPGATLPAVVVGVIKRRAGILFTLVCAAISSLCIWIDPRNAPDMVPWLEALVPLPVAVLAGILFLSERAAPRATVTTEAAMK
jgi:hypothetical protein